MAKVTWENPAGSTPPQGLYSHAGVIRSGTPVFLAGQVAVGQAGEVVGKGDFDAQFECVFKNIGDVLRGLGGDWSSIVKFTTYLVHSQDIERFMAQRQRLFPELFGKQPYPPNTLLVIDRLVKEEFLLEVEVVAAI